MAQGALACAPTAFRPWILHQMGRVSQWYNRAPSPLGIQFATPPCSVLAALVAPFLLFINLTRVAALMVIAVPWPPSGLKPIEPRSHTGLASQVITLVFPFQ